MELITLLPSVLTPFSPSDYLIPSNGAFSKDATKMTRLSKKPLYISGDGFSPIIAYPSQVYDSGSESDPAIVENEDGLFADYIVPAGRIFIPTRIVGTIVNSSGTVGVGELCFRGSDNQFHMNFPDKDSIPAGFSPFGSQKFVELGAFAANSTTQIDIDVKKLGRAIGINENQYVCAYLSESGATLALYNCVVHGYEIAK